ncbi:MAG: hypothetical protein ACI9FN_002739 [Saprospiraceae bacterium]|jgi:hypothetical protein
MNVAIVGGRSLLKEDLCEALSNHNVVLRLEAKSSPESMTAGDVYNCDFQDIVDCETFLSGIDCVIYSGLNWRGVKHGDLYNQIADIGCIVNEALKNRIKIIFLSDALSMGYHPKSGPYDESKVWNQSVEWSCPGFMYHLAERELYRGISEGMEAVVVRLSFMLGSKEAQEEFLSHISSLGISKQPVDGRVSIISRKDVVQLVTKLIHRDSYDHRFVNCAAHSLGEPAFLESIGYQKPDKKWYDSITTLWLRFMRNNNPPLLNRPDGLIIEYDNRRSMDWLGMEYLDLKSTLAEFQL